MEGAHVVIITEIERMTIPAANSLLKLLEEPPPTMHLLLTTAHRSGLLPTIISRCQEIRCGPLADADIERKLAESVDLEKARFMARISQGNYHRALDLLDDGYKVFREQSINLLRHCLKDPKSKLDWIDALLRQYSKKNIIDILDLMILWFRDVMIIQQNVGDVESLLINGDQIETLQRFVEAFDSIQYDTIFFEIENSIRMIERNIQLNLILVVLMIKLQKAMKRKG